MQKTSTSYLMQMVRNQLIARDITDQNILAAFEKIDRARFVPDNLKKQAYDDSPLPIGFNQTISQPFVVAYMLQQLQIKPSDSVLEIGTGSGYQTALLAELCHTVFSMDIVKDFIPIASRRLSTLGIHNVHLKYGNGYEGWSEFAPFDKIIVSAAPAGTPVRLLSQLKENGMAIIPVGETFQTLKKYIKHGENYQEISLLPVRFVPLLKSGDKNEAE